MNRRLLYPLALLLTLFVAFSAPATQAQSDPCSVNSIIDSFHAAALSDQVELWVEAFSQQSCPNNMLRAISALALGYRLATNDIVEVRVNADVDWNRTGITFERFDRFNVEASGEVILCIDRTCSVPNLYPPTGEGAGVCNHDLCRLRGVNLAALIGRIGQDTPFLIGQGGTFQAETTGELQLAVNDVDWNNNSGEFTVLVTIGG